MKPRPKIMQQAIDDFLVGSGLTGAHATGLEDTPRRFTEYLLEYMQPFDPAELLKAEFKLSYAGMVVQSHIPFRMICEHHLLPALGFASVGYIPHKKVVGLSKIARLVQAVGTEKPGLQESVTDRIVDLLNTHLEPRGVICVISAEHTCMASRGVNVPNVMTTTSSITGVFRDVPQAREEFFALTAQAQQRR